MQDSLELILADIYALEPSLKERDHEVRALVAALLHHKPVATVDKDFAQALRTKLLVSKAAPAPSSPLIPSPWMRYLVPLGAMAVLFLMLVPSYLGQPTNESERIMPSGSYDTFMAPETKRVAPDMPEEASMMMVGDAAQSEMADNDLGISPQVPGVIALVDYVSLLEPGFIVIRELGVQNPEVVIGVSYLLLGGVTEQVEIPLTKTMRAGATFSATLYQDNGDGIFDLNSDTPIYDPEGQAPLVREFIITF
ncbi:MAG TPA: hypothetical protein PKA42_00775 [Candidatus Paceibacterota bacterium]|nr:hypothetical protein [Candidatus Paceibacterota bacterium]HMO82676.1 hypothetical protein [Candidatus Paceibacterota bacterium]